MSQQPWTLSDVVNSREIVTVEEDVFVLRLDKDRKGAYLHVELDYDTWQHSFRLDRFQMMSLLQKLQDLLGLEAPDVPVG